jgi:hypothetical protein
VIELRNSGNVAHFVLLGVFVGRIAHPHEDNETAENDQHGGNKEGFDHDKRSTKPTETKSVPKTESDFFVEPDGQKAGASNAP